MDLKKVIYAEATTKEIALMTKAAMKKSKKLTDTIYRMNLISSKKPKIIGKELVKDFYETSHCYDNNGKVTPEGKKILENSLEDIG